MCSEVVRKDLIRYLPNLLAFAMSLRRNRQDAPKPATTAGTLPEPRVWPGGGCGQRPCERRYRLKAVIGSRLESFRKDPENGLRNRWHCIPLGTGRRPGQKMLEHSAQAEHIAPLVRRVPGEAFRRNVLGALTASGGRLAPELHGPEANELHQRPVVRRAGDQDGIRRQVAVDDAFLMRRLEAGGGLQDQAYRFVRGKDVACAEELGEELTPEHLECGPECPFLGLANVADARDVWVVDPSRAAELIPQVGGPIGLGSGLAAPDSRGDDQELDLDVRVEVFGEIEFSKGDPAQPSDHSKAVRQGATCEWYFGAGTRTPVV